MANIVAKAIKRPGAAKAPAKAPSGSEMQFAGQKGGSGKSSRLNRTIAKMRKK